jgi:putative NADH-flavin reductase
MQTLADVDFAVLAMGGVIEPGKRTGGFRLGGRTVLPSPEGEQGRISAEDYLIAMLD